MSECDIVSAARWPYRPFGSDFGPPEERSMGNLDAISDGTQAGRFWRVKCHRTCVKCLKASATFAQVSRSFYKDTTVWGCLPCISEVCARRSSCGSQFVPFRSPHTTRNRDRAKTRPFHARTCRAGRPIQCASRILRACSRAAVRPAAAAGHRGRWKAGRR
jgi:hypothetical protein